MMIFTCGTIRFRPSSAGVWAWALVFALLLSVIFPLSAFGQVTFEWGTIRHDTLYPTVEHCLAVVKRFEYSEREKDTVLQDSLPEELQIAPNSRPPEAVAAIRRCSDKFTVNGLLATDSFDINLAYNAFRLLYEAGRIEDAILFSEGAIAKIPVDQDSLRQILRSFMADFALVTRPTNFTAVRRLADSIGLEHFWFERVMIYGRLMNRATALRDTIELNAFVDWFVALPSLLGDSIVQSQRWARGGKAVIFSGIKGPAMLTKEAITYKNRDMLLARLEVSTKEFQRWIDSLDRELHSVDDGITGMVAEPLAADWVFPDTSSAPLPIKGKVSYMTIMRGGSICREPCYWVPNIKRLAARIPEVDYILVARTWGQLGWNVGGDLMPPDEARKVDSLFRGVRGYPGRVAVRKGIQWRLAEPDGRMIDEDLPQERPYPSQEPMCTNGICLDYRYVDRQGLFLYPRFTRLGLTGGDARERILRALLRQPAQ